MPFNQTGNENLGKALNFMKEFDAENLNEKICEIKSLQLCCSQGIVVCINCNHHQQINGELQRMYRCEMCRKEIWLTGGTFFDHVRKFRPYLATFYLLERGIVLSACDLSKVLSVSTCTADRIYKKVAKLVTEKMQASAADVPSADLQGVVCRRTRETPSRQHPLAEEVAVQKLLALQEPADFDQESKYPELSDTEKSVLELLSDTPIRFTDICEEMKLECANASAAIISLELRQLATRLNGDKYVRSDPPTMRASSLLNSQKKESKYSKITTKIIDFIEERFQGVSRKYLQFYAALYWIYDDRKRWGPDSIRQLCVKSRHIPYREILAFVTPPTVKVCARA